MKIYDKQDLMSGRVSLQQVLNERQNVKEVKHKIRFLKSLDLMKSNESFLRESLSTVFHGLELKMIAVLEGEFLYRAVKWNGSAPDHVNKLSYAPLDKIKEYGRANLPEQQVFYASAGCHSTIIELEPDNGDKLAISKWKVKKNFQLLPIGFNKDLILKTSCNRLDEINWLTHDQIAEQTNQTNKYIHKYLCEEFTKKVKCTSEYKLSAIFSHIILNSFKINDCKIDGLLYPSIPNEFNADNIAIKPDCVDECLELLDVQYVHINKTNDGKYKPEAILYSDTFTKDGLIEWKDKFPSGFISGTDHRYKFALGERQQPTIEVSNNKGVVVAVGNV